MHPERHRRIAPIGAQVDPAGVTFRVWSPHRRSVRVQVTNDRGEHLLPLIEAEAGYWVGRNEAGKAGDRYAFLVDDSKALPDVASRFQPSGVHGPSECIDPARFPWECHSWRRPAWQGQVTCEIHIGTFTAEGTFQAAIARLPELRDVGIEAVELMPVAQFAGARNWGYDGVALYAPANCYGRPDDLRAFVDAAHQCGLAVILDVVYNHVGPQGSYLGAYSPSYLHTGHPTPWGLPFNVDGPDRVPVRDFILGNVAYWLEEFRIDGLRLDATHAIPDTSSPHILAEIAAVAHALGAFVIAEDERNKADLLRATGSERLDALWADDFHHEVRVALTRVQSGYFAAYRGTAADIAQTLEHGWKFRGQSFVPWEGRSRGSPCRDLPARAFVHCLENHDQVGNRPRGERLEALVPPASFRAASMLLCLAPYAPLIFMGQEWAAGSPFLYFTDHGGDLGRQVSEGRRREFRHFEGAADLTVPDPEAPETFMRSKLDWAEARRPEHAAVRALYRECLRERAALRAEGAFERSRWTVRVAGEAIAVHYLGGRREHLLLASLTEHPLAKPNVSTLFTRQAPGEWRLVLSSESTRFGGAGEAKGPYWGLDHPGAVWLTRDGNGETDAAR